MKTIRNQQKYPVGLWLAMFLMMGMENWRHSISLRLQKEQQIYKQKISETLPENAFEAVKPEFGPKICSIATSSNTDNVLCASQ